MSVEGGSGPSQHGLSQAELQDMVQYLSRDQLLSNLYSVLRNVAFYDRTNRAVDFPAKRLNEALTALGKLQGFPVQVTISDHQLFLGDQRVQLEPGQFSTIESLQELLQKETIGGFIFLQPPTADQIIDFSQHYNKLDEDDPTPSHIVLNEILPEHGLEFIQALPPRKARRDQMVISVEELSAEAEMIFAYIKNVSIIDQILKNLAEGESLNRKDIRPIVQDLLEVIRNDPDFILNLTQWPLESASLGSGLLNTALLSLTLATKMKLSRALHNQIGELSIMTTYKRATRKEPEIRDMVYGELLEELAQMAVWNDPKLRELLFQFGIQRDNTKAAAQEFTGYIERIFHVSYEFMKLTHHNVQVHSSGLTMNRPRMSTFEAISQLLSDMTGRNDTIILKALINIMGFFAVGTLLRFADGRDYLVVGYDENNQVQVTVRMGPDEYGEIEYLDSIAASVVGVFDQFDARERMFAIIGEKEREKLLKMGSKSLDALESAKEEEREVEEEELYIDQR